ncbi:MAG: PrsW family glutamic-type intramembrane protease [Anaerolineales bacterium]
MGTILGLLLALIVPLYFLRIIRKFDFYQIGQFHIILICLFWGGLVYAPATFTNFMLENLGLTNSETTVHLVAPISEEIFKGLVLLYFVRRAKFTYSVDGALYGFAVGIGFAVVENFDYISANMTEVMIIAVQRIFSANLIHASSSALLGIALCSTRLKRLQLHWLIITGGLIMAVGPHMFYNMISHNGIQSLIASIFSGFLSAGAIIIIMKYSQKQTQNWIKEKFGMADRVTRNEVVAINRLAIQNNALYPIVERFGAEKASQVEQLLYLEARLGIKRKSLDSLLNNDALRNSVETEIREMRTKMEEVRRSIGTYVMLFVRGLFTKEMISVWEQMQAKIREQSTETDGQKGGGLWSSLEERVKSPLEEKGAD